MSQLSLFITVFTPGIELRSLSLTVPAFTQEPVLEHQLPSPETPSPPQSCNSLSPPPPGFQPFVFAFPCATLITVLLVFLMYMTVRSAATQKDIVEVGAL